MLRCICTLMFANVTVCFVRDSLEQSLACLDLLGNRHGESDACIFAAVARFSEFEIKWPTFWFAVCP